MASITINDVEDDALQGLPWDAQILYMRGLRRQMDFRSGEVGRRHRVSWRGFSDVLFVEQHQGCEDTGKTGVDRLKRAARWLVRAGLVEMRSVKAEKHLIFFLPLADRDQSVQNKPARNPPDLPAPVETAPDMGFEDNPAYQETHKPAQYPVSGKNIRNGKYHGESIAREEIDLDAYDLDVAADPPLKKASTGIQVDHHVSPHVALAVFLRQLNIEVTAMHPFCHQWVTELDVSTHECMAAADVCKRYLGNAKIPAKYFDQVLRSQRKKKSTPSINDKRKATYERIAGGAGSGNVIELWPDADQLD